MGKEFNPGRRIFLGLMLTWAASRLASCVPGVRGQEIQDGDEVVVVRDGGAPCVRNIFDGEFNCWRKATEDPDNRVATLPVGTVLRARGHENYGATECGMVRVVILTENGVEFPCWVRRGDVVPVRK